MSAAAEGAEVERENMKEAPRPVWTQSGAWSDDPEIMTWAEIKSQILNQLCHPAEHLHFLKKHT